MEYGPTARLTIIALTLISHTMGCASQGGDGHWTHMLMRDQPYYLSGPQQGRQPDGNLSRARAPGSSRTAKITHAWKPKTA